MSQSIVTPLKLDIRRQAKSTDNIKQKQIKIYKLNKVRLGPIVLQPLGIYPYNSALS